MDASRGSSSSASIFPALLLSPPPPPPPATALPSSSLSLSSYSSSSASLRGHTPSITSFPILLLTVLGILAASVLLLAYYVFVIRCCLTWHRDRATSDVAGLILSRRGRRPQRTAGNATTTTTTSDAEPRGLDDAAIRALPAFSYKKKPATESPSAPGPASDCAVCLAEFEDGDRVRMLPACLHVFHLGCIDAWLQGNASCPLCRTSADAAHCRLLPPLTEEEVVVEIQVAVVPGGAEEDNQCRGTLPVPRQQRQDIVALAPAEFEGEDHQVGGEKTTSAIDACHGRMTERRFKDGEVLPPATRRSFSMEDGDAMAGGGEVHLQIQSILQRDSHSRTHADRDSDSSGGARV